jgi:hypothetical protein
MNLGCGDTEREVRKGIIWTICFAVLCVSFYFMIYFKDWNDAMKQSASLGTVCPSDPTAIDIADAYDDFQKPPK